MVFSYDGIRSFVITWRAKLYRNYKWLVGVCVVILLLGTVVVVLAVEQKRYSKKAALISLCVPAVHLLAVIRTVYYHGRYWDYPFLVTMKESSFWKIIPKLTAVGVGIVVNIFINKCDDGYKELIFLFESAYLVFGTLLLKFSVDFGVTSAWLTSTIVMESRKPHARAYTIIGCVVLMVARNLLNGHKPNGAEDAVGMAPLNDMPGMAPLNDMPGMAPPPLTITQQRDALLLSLKQFLDKLGVEEAIEQSSNSISYIYEISARYGELHALQNMQAQEVLQNPQALQVPPNPQAQDVSPNLQAVEKA